MTRRTLNLGIVAHVDAGKTSLTERLLYTAGVIAELGSVDEGTTQTDSLALEQQRGITIKSAVASFAIDDVTVNLLDTPGHPDFIAEVERVLSVLDGAVLVISAVEGVQPQTRLLMRALERLRIPTLLFVNKIDRAGAGYERVLEAISERLTPAIVAMGAVDGLGTRAARFTAWGAGDAASRKSLTEALAEQDDSILVAYVEDDGIPYRRLRAELATQTREALLHPVYFGSALTGAGTEPLMAGLVELLPTATGNADERVSASVFKVERGGGGEKVAYARVFSGNIHVRDRVRFRRDGLDEDEEAKVTAISVFDPTTAVHRTSAFAGEIAKLWGLAKIQIGDAIGEPPPRARARHSFTPPTLEAVVVPRRASDKAALYVALAQLAEQDPLINVRRDDRRREISVSLYGEVQKEVIEAALANDYGIDVGFRETTTIYVERPTSIGEAVEILNAETNPFHATVGLRIGPGLDGSGIDFRLEVDSRTIPLYAYKKLENFAESMGEYVHQTLKEGLFGWQVTDCVVTMTECDYCSADGPPSTRGPRPTAADFRKLTPIVLMQALERAGMVVCEPIARVRLEMPAAALGAVLPRLARLGADIEAPALRGQLSVVETVVPSPRVDELRRRLPGLTGGEGVLEASFGGYRPVSGNQPTRRRSTPNPLNRADYLLHLAKRVGA